MIADWFIHKVNPLKLIPTLNHRQHVWNKWGRCCHYRGGGRNRKRNCSGNGQRRGKSCPGGINEDKLKETAEEFQHAGFDAIPVKTDIINKASVQAMAKEVFDYYERIDILVNCAGVAYVKDAVTFDEEKWDLVMDVNVKGSMLTCQAVGKYMLQQKKGRIINFSSVRGQQGKAKYLAYATSKGAVNLLTKTSISHSTSLSASKSPLHK